MRRYSWQKTNETAGYEAQSSLSVSGFSSLQPSLPLAKPATNLGDT